MSINILTHFVNGIKSSSENNVLITAQQLHHFVGTELKELPFDESNNFLECLNQKIFELVSSSDFYDKRAGILAIMSLIGTDSGLNSSRLSRCANYLRNMLPSSNQNLVELASKAIGYLALSSDSYTAEYVDFETKRAFEWLCAERNEEKRLTSVFILKELALCTPTFFVQYLPQFFEAIFVALKDTKPIIREKASYALRAVLYLVNERETKDLHKPPWYQISLNQALSFLQEAMSKEKSFAKEDKTHAGLLIINELIKSGCIQSEEVRKEYEEITPFKLKDNLFYKPPSNSKVKLDSYINFLQFQNQMFLDFICSILHGSNEPYLQHEMLQSEVCRAILLGNLDLLSDHIYKSLTSRNMHVQLVLLEIIPRLAFLKPDKFNKSLLSNCLSFIVAGCKKDLYKSPSYYALGYITLALKNDSFRIFPKIYESIKAAFTSTKDTTKKRNIVVEYAVFNCVRMLVKTHKSLIEAPIRDILEMIFSCGYSVSLINCLSDISQYIPSLKKTIQENILNYLSSIIMGKPHYYYTTAALSSSTIPVYITTDLVALSKGMEIDRLALAIKTLRTFDFDDYPLLELIKYISEHNILMDATDIRIESVKTCFNLLDASTKEELFNPLAFDKSRHLIFAEILERLIPMGVNDKSWMVRLAVFESLNETYDPYLVQPKHFNILKMAYNDDRFEIRENILCLFGRLNSSDTSTVQPQLLQLLRQILSDIKESGIGRIKEHGARLLTLMIANCPSLIPIYIPTILKVLNQVLKDPGPNVGVVVNAIAALGELAHLCGTQTKEWIKDLFPITISMLNQKNLSSIREVSLWTLGQMVESGGYVIQPYIDYPELLDIFLNYIRFENGNRIRYETIRVMGIIGAIDPFIYKNNVDQIEQYKKLQQPRVNKVKDIHSFYDDSNNASEFDFPDDLSVNDIWVRVNASLDDFYPCAAISCLMKIVKDAALSQHHTISVQALTFIFKSLGSRAYLYMRRVIPTFLILIKKYDNSREFIFQQLGIIVSLVKIHMRPYLDDICTGIKEFWNTSNSLQAVLINLINQLVLNIGSEFRGYLPEFIPYFLRVLNFDTSHNRNNTQKALTTLQTMDNMLQSYVHMLVSPILNIALTQENSINLRKSALETLDSFLYCLSMKEYGSLLVHPILSILDNPAATGPTTTMLLQPSNISDQNVTSGIGSGVSSINPFSVLQSSTHNNQSGTQTGGSGANRTSLYSDGTSSDRSPYHAELRNEALKILTSLLSQGGKVFMITFNPVISKVLTRNAISYNPYDTLIMKFATDLNTIDDRKFDLFIYNRLPRIDENAVSRQRMENMPIKKLDINSTNLQKSWSIRGRISRDDWMEWLKRFSIDVLKESPIPSLRSCWALAQNYAPLAKDLFNASFVSCWLDLGPQYQDDLIFNLQEALLNSDVPEVVLAILNLAEFMDHCEKGPLPLDTVLLGQQALKFKAYAKALRYNEEEFYKNATPEVLESLIYINNKLKQTEASTGILNYALKHFPEELKSPETWYEKLEEWEAAYQIYKSKIVIEPTNESLKMGAVRCLEALGEWSQVLEFGENWWPVDKECQLKMASLSCSSAWGIGDVKIMEKYLNFLPENNQDGAFYRAVLNITQNEYKLAKKYIQKCRDMLEPELATYASESYERAYYSVLSAQTLSEMEESIQYKLQPDRRTVIKQMWWDRLMGCQKLLSNWHKVIQVHSLVITPAEDQKAWLKYVGLCLKNGRTTLAHKTLIRLLGFDPVKQIDLNLNLSSPPVVFAYLKYIWKIGQKNDAFTKMLTFVDDYLQNKLIEIQKAHPSMKDDYRVLLAKCYYRLGQWTENLNGINDSSIPQILNYYVSAIDYSTNWYKAWHSWACINFEALIYYKQRGLTPDGNNPVVTVRSKLITEPSTEILIAKRNSKTLIKNVDNTEHTQLEPLSSENLMNKPNISVEITPVSPTMEAGGKLNEATIAPRTLTESEQLILEDDSYDSDDYETDESQPDLEIKFKTNNNNNNHNKQKALQQKRREDIEKDKKQLREINERIRLLKAKLSRYEGGGETGKPLKLKETLSKAHTPGHKSSMKLIPEGSISLYFSSPTIDVKTITLLHYVVLAVKGFIQSISFSYSATSLQDTLRLLTLCFDYGHIQEVYDALQDGILSIRIDNWLQVIPQLIARIDTPRYLVKKLIHQLLIEIGCQHPQALIYPLTVASKSDIASRKDAASKILQALCENNKTLVQQSMMMSEELIRISILWNELWFEGLEDASRLYYGDKNIKGMLELLEPLQVMIDKGPQTIKETSFMQTYGKELVEAREWCHKYLRSNNPKELAQAWDIYYQVFKRITKEIPQINTLQLHHVSPKLFSCRDMELAVPGTYNVITPYAAGMAWKKKSQHLYVSPPSTSDSHDINTTGSDNDKTTKIYTTFVRIAKVQPTIQVISSKQRPKKLRILGENGLEYEFLLKGHEDLRQDERVMQLFGLINTFLKNDSESVRRNLMIQRYSVIPLSTNSGLISWVPHCDTLHTLIKEYRDSRKILLNIEYKLMVRMAPDYDKLPIYQKVEIFEQALTHLKMDDMCRILWLKSPPNSQDWFERRTNYTRSLALMSVVGYILGLGDRHPSNLMLDRDSGKILHIDFGDCFEVAMHREKYPEKVPFRLTRMLVNAMEVSGIEGTFRMTCERVMELLHLNRDSVMSVLEAFVYDPLINWRILASEAEPESLNLKALAIIKRVKEKLTGRDFDSNVACDIKTQIDLLIKQATSTENLCQLYTGWCPFW